MTNINNTCFMTFNSIDRDLYTYSTFEFESVDHLSEVYELLASSQDCYFTYHVVVFFGSNALFTIKFR
jgi:hypothetical protein